MESYEKFLARINSFEKPETRFDGRRFECNPSLGNKVAPDNSFRDFYGDTTVFELDGETRSRIAEYIDRLYAAAPECFCERLVPSTLHVTLHDLCASPELGEIARDVFENEIQLARMKNAFDEFAGTAIRFKSKYVFNMVNTSVVLGLYPADGANHDMLMRLYTMIDGVKTLGYPLTPHVTLAYYNAHGFDEKAARALEAEIAKLNREPSMNVAVHSLFYQKFTSMNDYANIIKLI